MTTQALIQLLDLLPHNGVEDSLIQCSVRSASLADDPEYEALSYVWSDDVSPSLVEVEVAGEMVAVTSNLHSALRRLRLADKPRALWIDQLCINQLDAKEKATQVRLMREIYSSCRCCILWMGEIPDYIPLADAQAVVSLFEYMAASYAARESGGIPGLASIAADPEWTGPSRAMATLVGEDLLREDRYGLSWWGRIWTVQEAALPKKLVMMWGPLTMPWEKMIEASLCWTTATPWDVHELSEKPNGPCLGSVMAKIVWLEVAKSKGDSPLYLVFRWRHRSATDPRDKAYALMGLCEKGSMPLVEQCDYDMPTTEVFCRLSTDLILSEGTLTPLIVDPRAEPDRATPGLPRWALDVASMPQFNTDWFHLYGYHEYIAHGDHDLDLDAFKERMLEEPEVLRIEGSFADTVAYVGTPFRWDKRFRTEDQMYIDRLKEWHDLGRKHAPNRLTFWEDFGRTVLGDLIRDGEQWVERHATTADVHELYEFMLEGGGDEEARRTVKRMAMNQTFFVTRTGLLGMGHVDTKPGEEVWVLRGGKMPFTLAGRAKEEDGYDFGGKCYVHGLMNGELFYFDDEAPPEKMLRIH